MAPYRETIELGTAPYRKRYRLKAGGPETEPVVASFRQRIRTESTFWNLDNPLDQWPIFSTQVPSVYVAEGPGSYEVVPRPDRFLVRLAAEVEEAAALAAFAELGLVPDLEVAELLKPFHRLVYQDPAKAEANPFTTLARIEELRVAEVAELDWVPLAVPLPRLRFPEDGSGAIKQWNLDKIKVQPFWPTRRPRPPVALVDNAFLRTIRDLRFTAQDTHFQAVPGLIVDQPTGNIRWMTHGMVVASVAAAIVGNQEGLDGVAGGFPILPGAVGEYAPSDVASAISWAVRNGAWVINLSLQTEPCAVLVHHISIAWGKGALLVAGTGNGGPAEEVRFPAAHPGVVAVGGSDREDQSASFNPRGGAGLDLLAPGVDIPVFALDPTNPFVEPGGTSLAAPHVSGVAALLRAYYPEITNGQLRQVIEGSCHRPPGVQFEAHPERPHPWNPHFGYGRLDCSLVFARAEEEFGPRQAL